MSQLDQTSRSQTAARRSRRRDARMAAILASAWKLARRDGLLGISLRDLADMVDLAQPSLYSYFASKADLYDAMFAEGNRQLIDEVLGEPLPDNARDALVEFLRRAVMFSSIDPVRHELLFQRPIPGFEPSATSYEVAEEFYRSAATLITAVGVTAPGDVDLFTAIAAGLSNQQVANDPGGDRWAVLAERAVNLFLAGVSPTAATRTDQGDLS